MKKAVLAVLIVILAIFGWYGFTIVTLPPPPEIDHYIGEEVVLDFEINKLNASDVELRLVNSSEDLFVHFSSGNVWSKGRPGLAVKAMQKKSQFGNSGMTPAAYKKEQHGNNGKDFGQFMRDSRGKDVKQYKFRHQLAEGDDGELYMKMAYDGPRIPLVQVLEFGQSIPVPESIADQFDEANSIQFKAGTYYLDRKENGFWLPVEVD